MISASMAAEIDAPSARMYALANDHRSKFLHLLGSSSTRDELDEEKQRFAIALANLARQAKVDREEHDHAVEDLTKSPSTRSHGNVFRENTVHHGDGEEGTAALPWLSNKTCF